MAVTIMTYIHCDGCNDVMSQDMGHLTATEQRRQMRANGWVYTYNKDLCPKCRPKTKSGENIKTGPRNKKRCYPGAPNTGFGS